MKVSIDPFSGFCSGVKRTVSIADAVLEKENTLYSLGEIIHNEKELARLKQKGLIVIDPARLRELNNATVLIRAHGEPPETYRIAEKNGLTLLDTTCRIVKRLQNTIRSDYDRWKDHGIQFVIFGKKGHPEIIGLHGQTDNQAIIVSDVSDIARINPEKPVFAYCQTTHDQILLNELIRLTEARLHNQNDPSAPELHFSNTTCRQVVNRDRTIRAFAARHELLLFVSDPMSSNGKYLFSMCRQVNKNSKFVSGPDELQTEWFTGIDSVGITGGTSTPEWLLHEVAGRVKSLAAPK
jgi:4-hydroxy-3-methylbut-2-enyl diphosphate reductase